METPKARAKRYLDYFNLSIAEWEKIESSQNGVCYVCCERPASGKRLATDHCHATGLIRGLLCSHCNQLLGKIENALKRYPIATREKFANLVLAILSGMLSYVKAPPAVTALGKQVFTYPGRLGTKVHRAHLKRVKKAAEKHATSQTDYGENN